jgi:DeoR family transcriptional regulator, fructose operon transcriptional repressor
MKKIRDLTANEKKDLLPAQRQNLIKDFLIETGFVSIADLGTRFAVSEMTIRRDLDELERQGLIQRTYGGALPSEPAFYEMSFQAKYFQHAEEKMRIGKAAAGLVREGQTILLDSGTTTEHILKNLPEMRVTVITNALNIASQAMKHPDMEVMVAGGVLRKGLNYMVGPQTNDFLKTIRADVVFLAVEGVDLRAGFTVPDPYNADNKRAMLQASQRVVVVTDHSKLGRVSTSSIIPLDQANLLITGQEAEQGILEQLSEHIEVMAV